MLPSYKTALISKKLLAENVYLFTFRLMQPPAISFIPGQYLFVKVEGKPRLYSIASAASDNAEIEFIIELIPGGLASTYFHNLADNAEVVFYGPVGQFTLNDNPKNKIFLVTGTGIAPVRSIILSSKIENQISNPHREVRNFYIFWGLKTYRDVYLFEELKQLTANKPLTIKLCLSREKNLDMIPETDRRYFDLGRVDAVSEKMMVSNPRLAAASEYYLCGRREVVESLRVNLLSKNISSGDIHFEKF